MKKKELIKETNYFSPEKYLKDIDFFIIHKSEYEEETWKKLQYLFLDEALKDGYSFYDKGIRYTELNIPGWSNILDLNSREEENYLAIGWSYFPEKYKEQAYELLGEDFYLKSICFSSYDTLD